MFWLLLGSCWFWCGWCGILVGSGWFGVLIRWGCSLLVCGVGYVVVGYGGRGWLWNVFLEFGGVGLNERGLVVWWLFSVVGCWGCG